MSNLFLDTSYIIALETADDINHLRTLNHWQNLIKGTPKLVTTSYIFDEMVTFFNSRNRHHKAVEVGNRLLRSSLVQFIHVDEVLFFDGWQLFQQYNDKSYSLTDCISFVVMTQSNIRTALSFDNHFIQAGFEKLP
ncbi:type II toxin-antitoxin system VapC family toxin [Planktothrix sp. FACHB-1365]|uniref:type II toxin-antitoxin system VapC family toxin n=1 Tax=Planktothrix sp. FACHB-1365 TaxID=2692855 RepID=UPI0016845B01|nr:PIN domain-containing protein [Planktothrix sp. FACHB-1365]MBD2484268.1 PIN domain-containing protein [Planktothrix sp. FACHB-1365]